MHIKKLLQIDELEAASRLEAEIWGASNPTSRALLAVFAHRGGVVLGAWDQEGLVGISVGFPGLDGLGRLYLHSHLLGVKPPYRQKRVGEALKREQWRLARECGFAYIGWTYDPLMAGNAWFNLHVLGARVDKLEEDAYGRLNDALNRDLPTHRFWVVWNPERTHWLRPSAAPRYLLIPGDMIALRRDRPETAHALADQWFAQANQWWQVGWRVDGVERDEAGVKYRWIKAEEGGEG